MKVSINWLKELVDLKVSIEEVIKLLPLRTIGIKEVGENYLELDMKGYNRADLLSTRGAAYEIAAITDSPLLFKKPDPDQFVWVKESLPEASVKVEDSKLTPLYCIAKISGLKVGPSPKEWVEKLNSSGMRSVNSIADVTNLVMLEYGQPTHAFDAKEVEGENIIVRNAREGEKLVTLDNKTRSLLPTDLLITDPQKAVGLAGVMGGKNSEVTDKTHTILLEAAIFDPVTIRKTASRLALHSEASKRFQHGLTATRLLQAVDAAIKMYQELGGKLEAISIVGNTKEERPKILVKQEEVNSLVGIDIKPEFIKSALEKLHFKVEKGFKVQPPYFRLDVNIEADVIEEVARMYGYEKIPSKPLSTNIPDIEQNPIFGLLEGLKEALLSLGLTEVQTYSYYSTNVLHAINSQEDKLIKVANPISAETEYLRENNWPNLVEVVAKNARQGFKDIAIFEIGKIYYRNEKEEAAEKYSLSIALMNSTDNPLAELYDIFNKLNQKLNLGIKEVESNAKLENFHPNRFIQLAYGEKIIGGLAEVHKRVTDKLGINQRVAILEIGLNKILM
ncbi:phenylalanine--tRNA ligase subunit beta [Patescibacteria group bacterium]|nr:phenylalanine--tRNA ligase subunit beta [Patescibacteria group bacterium]